jgi:RNA polymerase sigma-70 factor (ECF subfamily)
METSDLIARAAAGDHDAFRELVEVHSHELQVHCYRILGSLQDAEDALQETIVSAWRSLGDFGQRSSLRTWLYQIATNRCLSMLRADSRRPRSATSLPDLTLPEPTGVGDVPPWLEPYPDVLLDNLVDQAPGPEARYETTEAISLAFITALQLLPPRQRAVLVLRDVLGYRAGEVAKMLDATQESVQSALKRARATVDNSLPDSGSRPALQPGTTAERHLVAQLTAALERSDVQALVGILAEDVRVAMPPAMLEYRGIDAALQFFAAVTLRPDRSYRVVPTRANGEPAFGMYVADPHTGVFRAYGLLVVTIAGDRIGVVTGFDASVLPRFGLPRTLPPLGLGDEHPSVRAES